MGLRSRLAPRSFGRLKQNQAVAALGDTIKAGWDGALVVSSSR